jgi:hypothetical protein
MPSIVDDRLTDHPDRDASMGRIWFGSILIGLGCSVAILGIALGSYAVSSEPDTARSTLVGSTVPLILAASALLSLASVGLRPTAMVRWLTAHGAQAGVITACGLVIAIAMVWVTANAWPGGEVWCFPGAFALTAFLVTLGVRQALLPIAAALVLCGVLAQVASTLPQ